MRIEACTTRSQFLEFLNQPAGALASVTMKDLVQKTIDLGIKPVTFADGMSVSEGTVGRWQSGAVVPHDIMRRTAIRELPNMLASVPA